MLQDAFKNLWIINPPTYVSCPSYGSGLQIPTNPPPRYKCNKQLRVVRVTYPDELGESFKRELKLVTKKTTPSTFDERIKKLKEIQRGWINYFRMASIQSKLKEIDGWLRNRLRYCIWEDWKKPERKRKNLIRLGIPISKAYAWSRTRMGGWAVAQSPIMVTTITLTRLIKRGYKSMLDYYATVSPQLNEPLYTRPVRTVV